MLDTLFIDAQSTLQATLVCDCGRTIERTGKRGPIPKRCHKCQEAIRAESQRVAAEKQRRKRGITRVKGTLAQCERCDELFERDRSIRAGLCPKCRPQRLDADEIEARLHCANPDCGVSLGDRKGLRGPLKKYCDQCAKAQKAHVRQVKSGAKPLGSLIPCEGEGCDQLIPRRRGNHRFCLDCSVKNRRKLDLDGYYRRQGRVVTEKAGSVATCKTEWCGATFVRTRADNLYCDPCLTARGLENAKRTRGAKRRAAGIPIRSGISLICANIKCKLEFTKQAANQKYCPNCKSQSSIHSNRRRRLIDPIFALRQSVHTAVWKSLDGFAKGTKGGRSWEKQFGYTVADLAKHLERQFTSKMTWENRGVYWELEHIRPIASFNITSFDCQEMKDCWALTNLRPLEKKENREKSDRRIYLI